MPDPNQKKTAGTISDPSRVRTRSAELPPTVPSFILRLIGRRRLKLVPQETMLRYRHD